MKANSQSHLRLIDARDVEASLPHLCLVQPRVRQLEDCYY